jgi:hypothetical protein
MVETVRTNRAMNPSPALELLSGETEKLIEVLPPEELTAIKCSARNDAPPQYEIVSHYLILSPLKQNHCEPAILQADTQEWHLAASTMEQVLPPRRGSS